MCYSALVQRDLEKLEEEFSSQKPFEIWDLFLKSYKNDPKKFKPHTKEGRVYPNYYTPIFYAQNQSILVEPMKYSTFIPNALQKKRYTSYNVRLDNIQSTFWSDSFGVNHGFIPLRAFFEWVSVRDLLASQNASIEQIKKVFDAQTQARKLKILDSGKKYTLTKTEQKETLNRDVVVSFKPSSGRDMYVPVIFNHDVSGENPFKGFAIVTDEPTEFIKNAGHDRCPVILSKADILQWLSSTSKSPQSSIKTLQSNQRLDFNCLLDDAI